MIYIYIKGIPKLMQDLNLPPFSHQVVGNPEKRTVESLELVKMERYTMQQHVFIIEQYFKNNILKILFYS